jgi:CRP-like cAMP-binding protein
MIINFMPVAPLPSPLPCPRCPLNANPRYRSLAAKEVAFMTRFKRGERHVPAGETVLAEGAAHAHLYTVLEGWALRYKTAEDGQRQILNFVFPGDMIGLQGPLLGKTDHSVEALTPLRLCVFDTAKLWALYQAFPELGFDITWLASREERFLDANLLSIGRRSAVQRVGYLIADLIERSRRSAGDAGSILPFPLTQQDVSDALGLSVVSVNRAIRRLKALGLMGWGRGHVEALDVAALRRFAGLDGPDERKRPFI